MTDTAPTPMQLVRDAYERVADGLQTSPHDLSDALNASTDPDGNPLSPTAEQIHAERIRQPTLGYDGEHDEGHELQLARAAYCYAETAAAQIMNPDWAGELYGALQNMPPTYWPWAREDWRPSADPIRNLIKAGALAAAAGDAIARTREDAP